MKIYDRNRNALTAGQRDDRRHRRRRLSKRGPHRQPDPYQAEHEKCVLLANSREQYAPIELIRLG